MKRTATSPILLWWGGDLRLLAGRDRLLSRTLAPGDDPIRALAQLAEEGCDRGGRLRLVYQPDSLDPHDVSCPQVSRGRLRRILATEFRALAAPATVWAAEPIRLGRDGYGTRLHLDPASRLPDLVAALAARGHRLEGAWSLLSLVEAAAAAGVLREGIHLVATAQRALVACRNPAGDRWVRFLEGPDFWDSTLAALRAVQAQFEERERTVGNVILEAGSEPEAAGETFAEFGLTALALTDLLAVARSLAPGSVADFLPRPPLYARRPVQAALIAACGLGALGIGGLHLRSVSDHREQRRREMTDERVRRQQDQTAAADRRIRELRSEEVSLELAQLETEVPRQAELLTAIARALPAILVLKSVEIDAAAFTLTGSICAAAPVVAEAPDERFRRDLAAAGDAWQLEPVRPGTAAPDFSVHGHFRPAAPGGGGGAASPADRLAAAAAELPDAAAFAAQWPALSRAWLVEAGPTDRFPAFELRRYRLSPADRQAGAWPALVTAIAALCRQPGLSIRRLALVAEPGGTGALRQAEISVEIRLRP